MASTRAGLSLRELSGIRHEFVDRDDARRNAFVQHSELTHDRARADCDCALDCSAVLSYLNTFIG